MLPRLAGAFYGGGGKSGGFDRMDAADLRIGADNLLITCGGLSAGDRLLVLHEDPGEGYYDTAIVEAVVARARALDIDTQVGLAPFTPMGAEPSRDLVARMQAADRTLFLSRSGDQIRFRGDIGSVRPIMSYALDAGMLASGFGQASHRGFIRLKDAVNALIANTEIIRLTCPLGTDLSGPGAPITERSADVSLDRFPMLVHAPIPIKGFSGTIVQGGFLVGTGSRFYAPYHLALGAPLRVHFDGTRITGFDGTPGDVAAARAHYQHVGALFGLDPFTVHSWHAGIHPGCTFNGPAYQSFERWSGSAFGNPRLMHFHTCGPTAPGEISLNILDPTIRFDGVPVWSEGVFDPTLVPGGAEVLAEFPCVAAVFSAPERAVGQGANGRLSAA